MRSCSGSASLVECRVAAGGWDVEGLAERRPHRAGIGAVVHGPFAGAVVEIVQDEVGDQGARAGRTEHVVGQHPELAASHGGKGGTALSARQRPNRHSRGARHTAVAGAMGV